jgi:hypothetical protein
MGKNIKQYAILDFRQTSIEKPLDHCWHIIYAEDYTSVVIRRLNEEDFTIKLLSKEKVIA